MLDAPGQQAVNVFHPVRGVRTCFPIISVLICFVSYLFSYHKGFPGGSAGKESAYSVGDPGSIPALGRSPGEG